MKRRFVLFVCVIAVLALFTMGCKKESEKAADVTMVKIGSLHPLSGGSALAGQQMQDAIVMAVDEINESGGIKSLGGAKVEIVTGDHEMKPEKGVSEVQRMIREGVVGVLGSYSSGVTLASSQETERAKIPFVVTISSVDDITERGFKYLFRLQPTASMFASDFINYIPALNKAYGGELKTVVISHENSIFGTSIANYLKENLPSTGLETLEIMPHSAGTAELTTDVNKIKSLNPDLLVPITYVSDGTLLLQTMQSSNYKPKAIVGIANGCFSNDKFITERSDLNQYIIDVNYTINPKSELADKVKAKYAERTGKGMDPAGAYSYEATKVLLMAVEKAGSLDPQAIRDALAETNYTGHILPQGPIVFNEKGQNANASAVMSQIADGKSLVVFPEEFKQTDISLLK